MSRESAKLPIAVVCIALLLVVFLIGATIASLEHVPQTVQQPPGREARDNPLLAAERMLRQMGLEVESTNGFTKLPPVDHALILAAERRVMTTARVERLLNWVERGGLLIVGPYLVNERTVDETWDDPLLERLGVTVESLELAPIKRETVELDSDYGDATFVVEFLSEVGIGVENEDTGELEVYYVVEDTIGDGTVVVLNDLHFLQSHHFGEHDHARFLWDLVHRGEHWQGALLIHGWGTRSLSAMIFSKYWLGLSAGTLLLGAWLWRRGMRFGPLLPAPVPGSRALLEHVEALGFFLWRTERADALIDGARHALQRQIQTRRPDFAVMEPERQAEALAVGSELDKAAIEHALYGGYSRRRENFVMTIRTLERLRRDL